MKVFGGWKETIFEHREMISSQMQRKFLNSKGLAMSYSLDIVRRIALRSILNPIAVGTSVAEGPPHRSRRA
jgi:hypothetical protein